MEDCKELRPLPSYQPEGNWDCREDRYIDVREDIHTMFLHAV